MIICSSSACPSGCRAERPGAVDRRRLAILVGIANVWRRNSIRQLRFSSVGAGPMLSIQR